MRYVTHVKRERLCLRALVLLCCCSTKLRFSDVAAVEVVPNGSALRWQKLDTDFSVPGLVASVFGNRAWMHELRDEWGRNGSKTKSEAKAAAARANGARGGRP